MLPILIRNIVFKTTNEEKKIADEFCDFLSGIEFELELALRENADFLMNEEYNLINEKLSYISKMRVDVEYLTRIIEE